MVLFFSISVDAKLVNSDGSYETVPLEKDVVTLAVIQTGINSLQDYKNPKVGLEENLDHMIEMGEKACAQNPKPDFLLFHEFPLTGYSSGSRTEKLKYTIQVPGPETEELGKLSKRCDAYLIFGSYATDADCLSIFSVSMQFLGGMALSRKLTGNQETSKESIQIEKSLPQRLRQCVISIGKNMEWMRNSQC